MTQRLPLDVIIDSLLPVSNRFAISNISSNHPQSFLDFVYPDSVYYSLQCTLSSGPDRFPQNLHQEVMQISACTVSIQCTVSPGPCTFDRTSIQCTALEMIAGQFFLVGFSQRYARGSELVVTMESKTLSRFKCVSLVGTSIQKVKKFLFTFTHFSLSTSIIFHFLRTVFRFENVAIILPGIQREIQNDLVIHSIFYL